MQRNIAYLHAARGDLLQQLRREMQTGGRCGGAAQLLGVHGLIALRVLKLRLYVGRQRHFAKALQHFEENALVMEADYPVPALGHAFHRSRKLTVAKGQLRAGLRLSARTAQAFPAAVPKVAQQHQLHAAAGESAADKSRGQYTGVIQNKAVPLPQQVGELIKMHMLNFTRSLIQMQKPRMVALLQRSLRDQLLRQIKIEIRLFHAIYAPEK